MCVWVLDTTGEKEKRAVEIVDSNILHYNRLKDYLFAQNEDARLVVEILSKVRLNILRVAGTPAVKTCASIEIIFIHSAVGGIIKSLLALFIHPDLAFRGKCDDVARHVYGTAASYCFQAVPVDGSSSRTVRTLMPAICLVDSAKLALYELPFQCSLLTQIEKSTSNQSRFGTILEPLLDCP